MGYESSPPDMSMYEQMGKVEEAASTYVAAAQYFKKYPSEGLFQRPIKFQSPAPLLAYLTTSLILAMYFPDSVNSTGFTMHYSIKYPSNLP